MSAPEHVRGDSLTTQVAPIATFREARLIGKAMLGASGLWWRPFRAFGQISAVVVGPFAMGGHVEPFDLGFRPDPDPGDCLQRVEDADGTATDQATIATTP